MSPAAITEQLSALCAQADGHEKVVLQNAVALIEQYGAQVKNLKWLASQRFRASSEKIAPGQLAMNFIEHLVRQAHNSKNNEEAPKEKKKTREKRRGKISALSLKQVDKKLDENERQCACGECKRAIGHDTRRQIIFEPSRLFILEERLWKYACSSCGNGVVMSKPSPKLVDGSLASSSILAHLAVSKVIDTTPVERVGKQLSRHGADLAPSTLCDWFGHAGRETMPLMKHIREEILRSQLISLDDTPLPTKNLEHPKNIQRGRLWLYLGDVDRIAYCQFSKDWKGKHPRSVLQGFSGDIQGDGYGGISALFHGADPPKRVGCNDHARRKFVEAMKLGDSRAEQVIALYARIYAVESQATSDRVPAAERLDMRQRFSTEIWDELKVCIGKLANVSPKGPLGKAIGYWRNQEATLDAFLRSGHLPISNGHVERLLRTVALMRKNSLFMGSIDAGHRHAALLTMALNCTLCSANPFDYFTWLFDRLAEGVSAQRAMDVMPQAWMRLNKAA
jgi:transposase